MKPESRGTGLSRRANPGFGRTSPRKTTVLLRPEEVRLEASGIFPAVGLGPTPRLWLRGDRSRPMGGRDSVRQQRYEYPQGRKRGQGSAAKRVVDGEACENHEENAGYCPGIRNRAYWGEHVIGIQMKRSDEFPPVERHQMEGV